MLLQSHNWNSCMHGMVSNGREKTDGYVEAWIVTRDFNRTACEHQLGLWGTWRAEVSSEWVARFWPWRRELFAHRCLAVREDAKDAEVTETYGLWAGDIFGNCIQGTACSAFKGVCASEHVQKHEVCCERVWDVGRVMQLSCERHDWQNILSSTLVDKEELSWCLSLFIEDARRTDGKLYPPKTLYYFACWFASPYACCWAGTKFFWTKRTQLSRICIYLGGREFTLGAWCAWCTRSICTTSYCVPLKWQEVLFTRRRGAPCS